MKKLIFLFICVISSFAFAFADEHPQAHYGAFGLEYSPTLDGYQKYVGQVVEYLPKENPSYDDRQFIKLFKGQFNTPYVIQKVSGNDKTIKLELVEKNNPKAKIKFEFLNYPEYYSYGKKTFANTTKYQVPLFLVEKFDEEKSQYTDKPLKTYGNSYVTIKGLEMYAPSENMYKEPSYIIYNSTTNTTSNLPISLVDKYVEIIGKTFSDPACNFTLTVVNYSEGCGKYDNKTISWDLLNSATNKIETIETEDYGHGIIYGTGPAPYSKKQFENAKSGRYVATLTKVEKPSNSAIRYGKTTEVKDESKNLTKFSYIDNVIDILIFATSQKFSFELKNISDNSIKVIWDEAVFVDADGNTSKVMHVGTKYSERNGTQPPTTLIKTAKIDDVATPTDRVYYSDTLKEWTSESMMPSEPGLKGKQLRLMLPIQIKDVINEYVFVFDLDYILNHPELLVNPEI